EARAAVVALRALSVEIDRIPLASKEERFGALRYEWWRRALNDVWRGSVPDQPALQALERVLGAGVPLTRYRAQRLVAAAEEEGGRAGAQAQPGSLADLHLAADARCGQLLWLELEAVRGVLGGRARGQGATREEILDVASGAENSAPAPLSSSHAALRADERAVKALGRALGVLRTMRGAAADLMAGKTRFPKDLCDRVGVDWSDVTHGRESRPFVEATRELAGDVQRHLDEASRAANELPETERLLFMPAVGARLWLRALEREKYELFASRMLRGGYTPLAHHLHLSWALFRKAV
ncbi:hypothetical protein H632_c719p1, partial [Helicosporidium sp. ATCC 50920]